MRFEFQERPSDSPYVETVWYTQSACAGTFTSRAVSRWEIVVTRHEGMTRITVRGPETKATQADCPADAEFLGIQFKLGTFMPHLPARRLVDGSVTLPEASRSSFWLHGAVWPFPDFDNADTFVDRLVRKRLLAREPIVDAALQGDAQPWSLRSIQYRFLHATGLTQCAVRQIDRAQHAAALLQGGVSIPDTVYAAGYFDQSHLTRSFKRLIGQTPAQLARGNQAD